jgi:tripartite-type tricarboxylate transporter receptor subunit TctC
VRRARDGGEVVGAADAKAAEALAELLDVDRRRMQVVGGGEAVERLAGGRLLIRRRRR